MASLAQPPLATLFDGPQPPPEQPAQQSTEMQLAYLLENLMRDGVAPAAAVLDMMHMAKDDAMKTRQQIGQWIHRAAKAFRLQTTATELEAQAATWRLVHHLFCVAAPAGVGGPRPGQTGEALVGRQHAADIIPYDPKLDRCARVVAWLEDLASEQLGSDTLEGFAQGEGLPFATMAKGRQGRPLDPDAAWREGVPLELEDMRNNERVMHRVWQLIRAGRLNEGVELALHVGQEWRAASLIAGGGYGPLPVGGAAESQDVGTNVSLIFEELAAEKEAGGETVPSSLWKWSCYQASKRGDIGHAGPSYELAVYAALSGNLEQVVGVCSSWEDAAWAHCRCLLDLSVDREMGQMFPPPAADPLEVEADELLDVLRHVDSDTPLDEQALVEGLAVLQPGAWPTAELLEQLTDLPGVFRERLPTLPKDTIRKACGDKYHTLQVRLILGELLELLGDDLAGDLQLQGGQWQLQPGADAMTSSPYLLLRFGAHLGLMLRALGQGYMVYESPDEGLPLYDYEKVGELTDKLVVLYCAQLLEAGLHSIVPHYAIHLRAFMRTKVLLQLLAAATTVSAEGATEVEPLAEAGCREVWGVVRASFEQAARRQLQLLEHSEAMAAEGAPEPGPENSLPEGLLHHMDTDVSNNELGELLSRLATEWSALGPLRRARTARWLFYPFLDEVQKGEDRLEVHDMVLQHILRLAHSLACSLDAPPCAAAAHFLAQHVVPEDYADWLATVLHQRLQELQSELEARGEEGVDMEDELVQQNLDDMEVARKFMEAADELQQLLNTFRHHSAVDEWLARAGQRVEEGGREGDEAAGELIEEGVALLQDTQALLEHRSVGWVQGMDELMQAVEASGGLAVALVLTMHKEEEGSDINSRLLDNFTPLQESQAAEFQHRVDSGIRALLSQGGGSHMGEAPLVSTQMLVNSERHIGYITLQLEVVEASEQAVQQLLDVATAALGGYLPAVDLPPLMLVDVVGPLAPLVEVEVSRRVVAARLLAAVQEQRMTLLRLGAGEDAGGGTLQMLAEPDSSLEQVARDVPKEVLQEALQREVDIQLELMRAVQAQAQG